ncbi:MAG: DinB family protein [Mycobacteriales bacterium]
MTETSRIDPPLIADEREMLTSFLDYHRDTLAMKVAGLSEEQMHQRSAPPSSMSLLGLVRHLADVERGWFRRTLGGETVEQAPPIFFSDESPDDDFDDLDTVSVDEALGTWRHECEVSREVVARAESLDALGHGRTRDYSLRWILVHMIEEYARHNGHADLLRERIDGATGE